jgi:PAS domain S-box-containing protein
MNKNFRTIEEDFTIAGKTINTEISFNPIRNNGEITGVSVFAREITEQKQAEIYTAGQTGKGL